MCNRKSWPIAQHITKEMLYELKCSVSESIVPRIFKETSLNAITFESSSVEVERRKKKQRDYVGPICCMMFLRS